MVLSAKKPSKPRAGCCALEPLDNAARANNAATPRVLADLIMFSRVYGERRAASRRTPVLDAGVPGVAGLRRAASESLADIRDAVRHGDAREILHVLVAKLARQLQARGRAMVGRKILTVHAVRDQRLRVQRVGHVDALEPVVVAEEEHVPGVRRWAHQLEHRRELRAGPFRD